MGSGFHNREAESEALLRSIKRLISGNPQWVAVLGRRKIGKTSLVLEAARRASTDRLRVVNLDVQEQGPVSTEVFRRLVLTVLDSAFAPELGESLERVGPKRVAGFPTDLKVFVLQ